MAITSNIVIDLDGQTATLTAAKSGDTIDVITYDRASNSVTFDSRPQIELDFVDFLDFCNQVNIFQTAILFNYSPNIGATQPFGEMTAQESHDSDQWDLHITAHPGTEVCNYQADKSSSSLVMAIRAQSKTLEFPEWLYFLASLNHYRLSIKAF